MMLYHNARHGMCIARYMDESCILLCLYMCFYDSCIILDSFISLDNVVMWFILAVKACLSLVLKCSRDFFERAFSVQCIQAFIQDLELCLVYYIATRPINGSNRCLYINMYSKGFAYEIKYFSSVSDHVHRQYCRNDKEYSVAFNCTTWISIL